MNEVKYNVWVHALAIAKDLMLVPEDEQYDNRVGQDGDGTSWNLALQRIVERFEEERDKAIKEPT